MTCSSFLEKHAGGRPKTSLEGLPDNYKNCTATAITIQERFGNTTTIFIPPLHSPEQPGTGGPGRRSRPAARPLDAERPAPENTRPYLSQRQHLVMKASWKDSIYLQREQLAQLLREPLERLARKCAPVWGDRERLNAVLLEGFATIPHCTFLYCVGTDGVQICDNAGQDGLAPGHFGRDRSQRPYMKEAVPAWGFLLSDAYISLLQRRPSLTALQVVRRDGRTVGYLGADFDLRNLPGTSELYEEPGYWRQIKGDPAIRGTVFQQCRVESPMDRKMGRALSILEELLTERGVFQCQIHFSSSQAIVWTVDDPYRYRILDHEALRDPDICLIFPSRPYPAEAVIPRDDVKRILQTLKSLRMADPTIYLRTASINLFNGMISLTFSCDGSHYMPYVEFLLKDTSFWF